MHPELEEFLERALDSVEPFSRQIGRVVVEPDYDIAPDEQDAPNLARELVGCISSQPVVDGSLSSPEGLELEVGAEYELLKKYLRRITLHGDSVEGAWVEVEPPGNWI